MTTWKSVQQRLLAAGFDPKGVDGTRGAKTNAAIAAFRAARGLGPGAVYDVSTHAALFPKGEPMPGAVDVVGAEPPWLALARKYAGLREIKGAGHAPEILAMWDAIGLPGVNDDETAWCAAFAGFCLEKVGIRSTRSARARSYADWGIGINAPVPGCILVLKRGKPDRGLGHVTFPVGVDQRGRVMGLGGNQADAVTVAPFDVSDPNRFVGYRWPAGVPVPVGALPLTQSSAPSSRNEA